jgi:hypothetical protein
VNSDSGTRCNSCWIDNEYILPVSSFLIKGSLFGQVADTFPVRNSLPERGVSLQEIHNFSGYSFSRVNSSDTSVSHNLKPLHSLPSSPTQLKLSGLFDAEVCLFRCQIICFSVNFEQLTLQFPGLHQIDNLSIHRPVDVAFSNQQKMVVKWSKDERYLPAKKDTAGIARLD